MSTAPTDPWPPHGRTRTLRPGACSVTADRRYGDAVAHSLGLRATPSLVTRSLKSAQIGINRLSIGPAQLGHTPRIPAEDTFIAAIYLTPVPHHELWSSGRRVLSQGYGANAMRIVNLVDDYSARITCPHESLNFYLPRGALDEYADEAGMRRVSHLACAPGTSDAVMTHLVAALLPGFEDPAPRAALFVDHVALAVCSHLTRTYGGLAAPGGASKGGLSAALARRAQDYLASRMADDVTLQDAARACGLSRSHFARAFRLSTGSTPYQWLQRHRIERAQQLLREPALSIVEIAAACGFADQSHLTRVFARRVGTSPAAWRRARR